MIDLEQIHALFLFAGTVSPVFPWIYVVRDKIITLRP